MTRFKVRKRLKIFLPSVMAIAILSIGILSSSTLIKEFSTYSPLTKSISQNIHIKESEVVDVFQNDSDELDAEKYAKFADRVDDLLTAGKITETQKEMYLDSYDPRWM